MSIEINFLSNKEKSKQINKKFFEYLKTKNIKNNDDLENCFENIIMEFCEKNNYYFDGENTISDFKHNEALK